MSEVDTLGRLVRETQDEVLASRDDELREVRVHLLSKPKRGRARTAMAMGMVAAVIAAAAVVVLWFAHDEGATRPTAAAAKSPAEPVGYEVDGEPGEPGRWLSTGSPDEMTLRFTDGSTIELSPDSDARVADARARGAGVELSRGRAQVDIPHEGNGKWRIDAGPFEVHVVGTAFDVGWDPEGAHFELQMKRGQVQVRGPLIGMRDVGGGRHLRVWLREGRVEETSPDDGRALPSPSASAEEQADGALALGPTVRGREGRWEPPDVDELARAGSYLAAVRAAEAAGWDRTLRRLDGPGLTRLADAARLAGRLERSEQAYGAVRRRFRGDLAANAAFFLGRLAMDEWGTPSAAARHFEAYLGEAPGGTFAREAAGRLIEARQGTGDAAAAREAAEAYLTQYPAGPHAALARSLVGP